MALSLPSELQQFADRPIASGKYTSDEILMAGLQALADHEQVYQGILKNSTAKSYSVLTRPNVVNS
jgi:Arc/MetJ-type ribon-helix-helix transcriptional regulator